MAPHHTDVPLKDIIDIVLSAKPVAVSFPAANARHEHEWKIWREVKKAEETPAVRERFEKLGVFPVADSPAEFAKFFHAELKAYGEQAKLANLQRE